MPKTTKTGKPKTSELPSTLQRSSEKAQTTFAKAFESALEEYGDDERAHRVAFAALRHTHEKVGDAWEAKATPGPSDAQAEGGKRTQRPTAGGADANATKDHLYGQAKKLGRRSVDDDEGPADRRTWA